MIKNKLLDILDYGIVTNHLVSIETYEFNLKSNFAYGGSGADHVGRLWGYLKYHSKGNS